MLDSPRWASAYNAYEQFDVLFTELKQDCGASKSNPPKPKFLHEVVQRKSADYPNAKMFNEDFEVARRALKAALFTSGEADLEEVLRQHPVLLLVLPRAFWVNFRFADWARGWEDTTDKQRQSVFCGIGWGLFGEELCTRVLAPGIKDCPDARYLLHVVQQVLSPADGKPWWSILGWPTELGELPADGSPQTSKDSAPPRRSGRGSTRNATNKSESDSRSGVKGKRPAKVPEVVLPATQNVQPRPKQKAPELKSKEMIESSDEEGSAPQADGPESEGQSGSEGAPSGPGEVDELESDQDDEDSAAQQEKGAKLPPAKESDVAKTPARTKPQPLARPDPPPPPKKPVAPLPDPHAATSRGIPKPDQDVHPNATQKEIDERLNIYRRACYAAVRCNATAGLGLRPTWGENGRTLEVTPWTESGVNESEVLAAANPGHIAFVPLLNGSIAATRYQSDLYSLSTHDADALELLAEGEGQRIARVMKLIGIERKTLRENVISFGQSLLTNSYGTDLALTGMARTLFNFKVSICATQRGMRLDLDRMKDIFVGRVMTHIENQFDENFRPIGDAVWMAKCDGLYEANLLTVDMESGQLWAHLKSTFPADLQEKGEYVLTREIPS